MKLIAFGIGLLISAVILRMTVRWAVKFTLGWVDAFAIAFISVMAGFVVDFITRTELLSVLASILVDAGIYGALIKNPEGNPIGFANGMLVLIYQLLLFAVIAGAVVAVYLLILKGSI